MARDGRLVAPHEGLQIADAHFLPADAGEELEARPIGEAETHGFDGGG